LLPVPGRLFLIFFMLPAAIFAFRLQLPAYLVNFYVLFFAGVA